MPSTFRPARSAHATLRAFLESDAAPKSAMSLEELHGFLTALISGAEMVLPSEYLPVVWGDDDSPEFESMEAAQRIMGAIMQLWNEIGDTLMAGEPFEPLLESRTDRKAALAWADGYLRGAALRHDAWRPALDNRETLDHTVLISQLADDNTNAVTRRQNLSQLPAAVQGLHAFWLGRRTPPSAPPRPTARAHPKIGRNDPCPCGSGRKYKHCCGKASNLH